jgi:hypothetical protein
MATDFFDGEALDYVRAQARGEIEEVTFFMGEEYTGNTGVGQESLDHHPMILFCIRQALGHAKTRSG